MSQNDLTIANQGFASFRSDLNSALQALGSTNSGTSAPSTTFANQLFYDTTNNILKIRNEDNDAFISLFSLDQTNDLISGFSSPITITTADNSDNLTLISTDADANVGPVMLFKRDSSSPADLDFLGYTKYSGENDASEETIYAQTYAQIADATNGTEDGTFAIATIHAGTLRARMLVDSTEVVFNDDSVDVDFRVESNNDTTALFVQGSTGDVGIGTNNPSALYANDFVVVAEDEGGISMFANATTSKNYLAFADGTSGNQAYRGFMAYDHANDELSFGQGGTTRIIMDSTGALTMPNQPAFLVTPSNSNQTNIAVNASTTLNFGTEIFDANDDFDNTNMFFTAPTTGKYQINCLFGTRSLDTASSHYIFQLSTSNRNYELQIAGANVLANDGNMYFAISQLCDMDTGDTAKMIVITASDGAQQVDINADSRFSGYLVA